MEYDNSICKYCKYRNSWDCSEGYYLTKGCENWSLDDYTLTDGQVKRIKNALMLTVGTELTIDTDMDLEVHSFRANVNRFKWNKEVIV